MDFIDTGDVATRYSLEGSPGPVLVLIHEMGGTLESWDEVADRLSKTWRTLRYDLRGAGLSEKLRGDVTVETLASDLLGLLDGLAVEQPVGLAGSAVGAAVALTFAALHPGRVAALALLSPATAVAAEARADRLNFADAVLTGGMRSIADATLDAGYPPILREGAMSRYASFRARWLANDPESFRFTYRMLIGMDLSPYYARVTCPVLGVGAEHDRLRPPSATRAIVDRFRDHRHRVLPTGHHAAVQTPDVVAATLDEFFGHVMHEVDARPGLKPSGPEV